MKNKSNKITIYNILIVIFSISFIILATIVGLREYKSYKATKDAENVLTTFESLADVEGSNVDYSSIDLRIKNYKVIGTIKIDSIGLEYPILERTTDESLNLSITKLYGPGLNELGNVSLAGHNTKNGTLFGKLSNVNIGDTVEITDLKNRTVKYEITKIFSVLPTVADSVKTTDEDIRELTLITCTMNGRKRLVVKAIEI